MECELSKSQDELDNICNTKPCILQEKNDFIQNLVPVLKYVRGENLSADHWVELFRMVGMPKGTTLEKLVFADILNAGDAIIAHRDEIKVGD